MKLAHYLKHADWYRLLYGEWSERSHAADVIDRILTHKSTGAAVRPLRDLSEFNSTVDFVMTFALEMTFALDTMRAIIRHYRPSDEEEQKAWYRSEISPVCTKIPTIEIEHSGD